MIATTRRAMLVAFMLCLSGCANYAAVSEFARRTADVSASVRTELVQLDAICRQQAETTIVVANSDDGPLDTCRNYQASVGRLSEVTLDVLDGYAEALAALANGKNFDVSPEIATIGKQLGSLKSRDGKSIIDPAEAGALAKIADVLADIATTTRREQAIRRLVDERPRLVVAGRILRSYFIADADAPAGRADSPYSNLAGIVSDSLDSTDRLLRLPQLRSAEPIRTVELQRALRARRTELAARTGNAAEVPVALANAIDAWLAALDDFSPDRSAGLRTQAAQPGTDGP
ncbi:MAG: hypothetical protein KKC79_01810 [Gammaproteobacteria bacterium]|nr:hypothetical protein [Gammaproteobacteria bacterium]MBU1441783.1 hypothetical protein [Gammaproteobacteria bacterium]MBU2288791.1 hypothetical protein [Gammaproteobacteria bacterium]MBU2407366.1 hypothetical protein [Gammaproteobacteria bacterium]